uniref:Uncharacterized protein n=1 Tax=Chromera velia CCMP2878 TaxID=1169474 RepID=A0A0G4F5T8_9ALVE|eukprot:Cvel_15342.t1-p1 / transcript=Cvel_15342.t1 / gene=Cvel_15342 / organism=Chromera_velia_CCMP2878 / gene_product=hypothetical protein / transcript_product=hypothetical protein / location=Cvel_scaffold1129:28530-31716(+) / protein_length=585 / sequence_SO=supercontig / SO=protein_coding / is_pseudo=false
MQRRVLALLFCLVCSLDVAICFVAPPRLPNAQSRQVGTHTAVAASSVDERRFLQRNEGRFRKQIARRLSIPEAAVEVNGVMGLGDGQARVEFDVLIPNWEDDDRLAKAVEEERKRTIYLPMDQSLRRKGANRLEILTEKALKKQKKEDAELRRKWKEEEERKEEEGDRSNAFINSLPISSSLRGKLAEEVIFPFRRVRQIILLIGLVGGLSLLALQSYGAFLVFTNQMPTEEVSGEAASSSGEVFKAAVQGAALTGSDTGYANALTEQAAGEFVKDLIYGAKDKFSAVRNVIVDLLVAGFSFRWLGEETGAQSVAKRALKRVIKSAEGKVDAEAQKEREATLRKTKLRLVGLVPQDAPLKSAKRFKVSDLQDAGKQHILAVAGPDAFIDRVLLELQRKGVGRVLQGRGVLVVPVPTREKDVVREEERQKDGYFGGFDAKATGRAMAQGGNDALEMMEKRRLREFKPSWRTSRYVADPARLKPWREVMRAEMIDAERQGNEKAPEGIIVGVRNTGTIVFRGVGDPDWASVVEAVIGSEELEKEAEERERGEVKAPKGLDIQLFLDQIEQAKKTAAEIAEDDEERVW